MENSQKGFIYVVIAVILAVGATATASSLYKATTKQGTDFKMEDTAAVQTEAQPQVAGDSASEVCAVKQIAAAETNNDFSLKGLSATEVYLKMRGEWDKAQNYNDLVKVDCTYGDDSYVKKTREEQQQLDASGSLAPSAEGNLYKCMKALVPSKDAIKVISENVKGIQATLKVSAPGYGTGMVMMVFENGVWKVSQENWDSSSS